MPKLREYVKTFKVEDRDKYKSNKLRYFHIDDEKLLENIKLSEQILKIWIECFTSLWLQIYKNHNKNLYFFICLKCLKQFST